MTSVENGRTVLRTFQCLRLEPLNETTLALDATRRAGAAMDLALRMRRHGRLTAEQVEAFAPFCSLSAFDLTAWCLPALRATDVADYVTAEDGSVSELEERVGIGAPVLEQASQLWAYFAPSPVERCVIHSADLGTHLPLSRTAHRDALERAGFEPSLHDRAFQILAAISLLRADRSPALGEDVLYSPYVWGSEALDIAGFVEHLPDEQREQLGRLAHATSLRPGVPFAHIGGDSPLLQGARKVGLIDGTRVLTTGAERGFAFPPDLERRLTATATDAIHERKLFVAHILNGHYFGRPATGRINNPIALVSAMINRGVVGPTTAAKTDYLLLESAGIVRARPTGSGRAYLDLVKDDVARESLELIERALEGDPQESGASSIDALWLPGSYTTPERDRRLLPEIAGVTHEILVSAVDDLRKAQERQESMQRRLRGEEFSQ